MASNADISGIRVTLDETGHSVSGRAQFQEWHLEYLPQDRRALLPMSDRAIVQLGDLTMECEPAAATLISLSLYTNPERWGCAASTVPHPTHFGALRFDDARSGDFVSYDGEPCVQRSLSPGWVRLVLADETPLIYARVGVNLISGISNSGCLVDFWLRLENVP